LGGGTAPPRAMTRQGRARRLPTTSGDVADDVDVGPISRTSTTILRPPRPRPTKQPCPMRGAVAAVEVKRSEGQLCIGIGRMRCTVSRRASRFSAHELARMLFLHHQSSASASSPGAIRSARIFSADVRWSAARVSAMPANEVEAGAVAIRMKAMSWVCEEAVVIELAADDPVDQPSPCEDNCEHTACKPKSPTNPIAPRIRTARGSCGRTANRA